MACDVTVPIILPEENKNSFICFQSLCPRSKSKDAFMTCKCWAMDHKKENFTCDFKLGNSNNDNAKDGDEPHVGFDVVLCGNENELQNTLDDADLKTALGEPISCDLKAFNHINFVKFASGLSSSDTSQLYNPQSGNACARLRSFNNNSYVISR